MQRLSNIRGARCAMAYETRERANHCRKYITGAQHFFVSRNCSRTFHARTGYIGWKPWTRFIYEALVARGFVERVYIATQAANACLNTRDRSVYRPSSYLCTLRAKQICLRPLFVSWELREARSSRSHWCEFMLVEIARRELKSRWDISVMMYLWRRDFVVLDYSWDLIHGGNFVLYT